MYLQRNICHRFCTQTSSSSFFFQEDKCAKCDVHAHCENGKCVCDKGFYGDGYRGECFRVGGEFMFSHTPTPWAGETLLAVLKILNGRNPVLFFFHSVFSIVLIVF